jgi:glyoxylase I family protein
VERVTGIGGVFFRARDPETLKRWYEEHLGVIAPQPTYDERPWWQEQGPTIFAPFRLDSGFFGRLEQQWSVNFRVRDLDAIAAQLRGAGIEVEIDPETYPNGRFASISDPEGNPIQLWEPTPDELIEPPEAR